ncbi:hypothetical protein ANCCAN_18365 [Ancylostoma caninum]|uniref:Uncharacterized protein n=1 Tax=Ancylostoma caninum TaxID=29170 RepID=A0A368FU79_ANCCA|nr:hypothetical protein ANCCAN_18365 [Ancylostoma caninum]
MYTVTPQFPQNARVIQAAQFVPVSFVQHPMPAIGPAPVPVPPQPFATPIPVPVQPLPTPVPVPAHTLPAHLAPPPPGLQSAGAPAPPLKRRLEEGTEPASEKSASSVEAQQGRPMVQEPKGPVYVEQHVPPAWLDKSVPEWSKVEQPAWSKPSKQPLQVDLSQLTWWKPRTFSAQAGAVREAADERVFCLAPERFFLAPTATVLVRRAEGVRKACCTAADSIFAMDEAGTTHVVAVERSYRIAAALGEAAPVSRTAAARAL